MTELKPCPFCGGEAVMSSHPVHDKADVFEPPEEGFCIACECCCTSSSSTDACNVIDTWNNRPIEDKLKAKADMFDMLLEEVVENVDIMKQIKEIGLPEGYTNNLEIAKWNDLVDTMIACGNHVIKKAKELNNE